jgi:hypothetical protein
MNAEDRARTKAMKVALDEGMPVHVIEGYAEQYRLTYEEALARCKAFRDTYGNEGPATTDKARLRQMVIGVIDGPPPQHRESLDRVSDNVPDWVKE